MQVLHPMLKTCRSSCTMLDGGSATLCINEFAGERLISQHQSEVSLASMVLLGGDAADEHEHSTIWFDLWTGKPG